MDVKEIIEVIRELGIINNATGNQNNNTEKHQIQGKYDVIKESKRMYNDGIEIINELKIKIPQKTY